MKSRTCFAIDPSSVATTYVVWRSHYERDETGLLHIEDEILDKGLQVPNDQFLDLIANYSGIVDEWAIEMVKSYGNVAGADIFSCVWFSGRIHQVISDRRQFFNECINYHPRKTVLTHITGSARGGDSDMHRELVMRYGDKGTKKAPGFFYGFSKDLWQAAAVAVFAQDIFFYPNRNPYKNGIAPTYDVIKPEVKAA